MWRLAAATPTKTLPLVVLPPCFRPPQRHRTGGQSQAALGLFPEVLAAPQHRETQRGEAAGGGSKSEHRHVAGRVDVHFQVGTD